MIRNAYSLNRRVALEVRRQDGRKASAYELIARSTLEITYQHDH